MSSQSINQSNLFHGIRSCNIPLTPIKTNKCQRRNKKGEFSCSETTTDKLCTQCQIECDEFLNSFKKAHDLCMGDVKYLMIPSRFKGAIGSIESFFSFYLPDFKTKFMQFGLNDLIRDQIDTLKLTIRKLKYIDGKSLQSLKFFKAIDSETRSCYICLLEDILEDMEEYSVERQIFLLTHYKKINIMKMNMLSEIYFSNKNNIQSVFNKDINNKILSFLN